MSLHEIGGCWDWEGPPNPITQHHVPSLGGSFQLAHLVDPTLRLAAAALPGNLLEVQILPAQSNTAGRVQHIFVLTSRPQDSGAPSSVSPQLRSRNPVGQGLGPVCHVGRAPGTRTSLKDVNSGQRKRVTVGLVGRGGVRKKGCVRWVGMVLTEGAYPSL